MKQANSKSRCSHRRLISAGFVIAGMASVFGFAAMMYLAVTAVRDGRGMATYRTMWLDNES